MPHECLCWRPKKAENIMSTCILLYQLRLGCFLNKFLAKWQVSWKMQVGLQPATETMGTAEGMQVRKKEQQQQQQTNEKPKMQRRLQLLGTNEKTEKISALNPQEFCWRWTRYPTLLKQKIYLLSFISCTPAQLHFKPVPLAFNSFSFSSFPFSFPIFSVQSNSSR